MRKTFVVAMALALVGCSGMSKVTSGQKAKPTPASVRLALVPQESLTPGKSTDILAKLNIIEERKLLTADDLDASHTQKFHLLVVDSTLTDYQHIHPQPTKTPGVWSFTFTPKLAGYRAWADITPSATHKQEFAMASLGAQRAGTIDKTETRQASLGGYRFTLSFDKPPQAGEESMGSIRVTDASGQPISGFEPVMGVAAHIVGFYEDYRTVLHTHPIHTVQKNAHDHGDSDIMFHLEPSKAGFLKLFAQVKIGGREMYVPFGVKVLAH